MNKIIFAFISSIPLSGCIATLPPDVMGGGQGNEEVSEAIRQYDNERPGLKKICLAVDSEFNYATGEFLLDKKNYDSETKEARWNHLARLGLVSKTESRGKIIYKITQAGRKYYNNGKCSPSVERYSGDYSGPAFVYGILELDKLTKTQKNPYHPVYTTTFKKRFTSLENWATDRELRRAWKLEGLDEIQNFRWFASYRFTSNGVDFTETPQMYVLQD